jgi:ABC-type amino acid transport substrate-binding protein
MKNKIVKLLFVSLIAFNCFSQKIVFSTINWEPYIGESLRDNGFLAVIIKEAFKASGHDVKFKFVPWSRAVKMAADGAFHGFLPEYYSEKRLKDFVFSDVVFSGPAGLYRNTLSELKIDGSYKDYIKNKRIGLVRGYINTKFIDERAEIIKDFARNDLSNLKKLNAARVDFIFIDDLVAKYHISKNPELKYLEFIEPPLEMKELYVCFSKKKGNYLKLREDFNRGLKAIQFKIPRILRTYNVQLK